MQADDLRVHTVTHSMPRRHAQLTFAGFGGSCWRCIRAEPLQHHRSKLVGQICVRGDKHQDAAADDLPLPALDHKQTRLGQAPCDRHLRHSKNTPPRLDPLSHLEILNVCLRDTKGSHHIVGKDMCTPQHMCTVYTVSSSLVSPVCGSMEDTQWILQSMCVRSPTAAGSKGRSSADFQDAAAANAAGVHTPSQQFDTIVRVWPAKQSCPALT